MSPRCFGRVSQPSNALTARADAAGAFDTLFLGLGAIALLVGSMGRRPGRRCAHRRCRRAAARHPRRPTVTHPGTLEHL